MNRACVLLVAGAFALTAGAKDWVLPTAVTTSGSDALTNLKWWGGTDGARPTADDHLIVGGNMRIRATGADCPAGSFQLGTDDADGNPQYGEFVHDGVTSASFKTLKLHCGHWWCNQQKDYSLTAERIEVTSGAAYPFAMSFGQAQYQGKTMTVSGAVHGDENACLRLGYGKYSSSRYTVCASNETFVFDGFATYSGTVSVLAQNPCDGDDFGVRLQLKTMASPCALSIEKGGVLSTFTDASGAMSTVSVAKVTFKADSRFEPVLGNEGASQVRVTDVLAFSGLTKLPVYVNSVLLASGTRRLPILTAPSTCALADANFELQRGPFAGSALMDLEVGTESDTGNWALYLNVRGVVRQTNQYRGADFDMANTRDEGQRDQLSIFSSLTNATFWSDGQVPHDGPDYYTSLAFSTPFDAKLDYEFPGEALWLADGTLMVSCRSFAVPSLSCTGGSTIGSPSDTSLGSLPLQTLTAETFDFRHGSVTLRTYKSRTMVLDGPITGDAEILMGCWPSTGVGQSFYEFRGDNSGFAGTFVVRQAEARAQYNTFESLFATLYVNDGKSLGGAVPAFNPRALTLARYARLSDTNTTKTVTLSDGLNRGVYIEGMGRFYAAAGATLDIDRPLLLSGRMWKEGDGTVVFRKSLRHEETDGGALSDVPRAGSNRLEVVSGQLRLAHADALAGVETTVDAGATLCIELDPNSADMNRYGLRNVTTDTPFVLAAELGGKLPLTVDASKLARPTAPQAVTPILTVRDAAADAVRAMLPAEMNLWRGYKGTVGSTHDDVAKTTTFVVNSEIRGLVLLFW